MYIVPIAWLYVTLMMAVAEGTSTTGTVLGGIITFVLYGLGPVALVVYLMGTPARRKAIKAREKAEFERQRAVSAEPQPAVQDDTPPRNMPDKVGHLPNAADNPAAPAQQEP